MSKRNWKNMAGRIAKDNTPEAVLNKTSLACSKYIDFCSRMGMPMDRCILYTIAMLFDTSNATEADFLNLAQMAIDVSQRKNEGENQPCVH